MAIVRVQENAAVTGAGEALDVKNLLAMESLGQGLVGAKASASLTMCASAKLDGVDGGVRSHCVVGGSLGRKHAVIMESVQLPTNANATKAGLVRSVKPRLSWASNK